MERFESKKEHISLVEKQRQEALDAILETLEKQFPSELKSSFESHGKEYLLTSPEDCMVAFAQQHREVVEGLYEEIKQKDDYRAEQAIAKLHSLFLAYEKTVVLYAELRSYYPKAAGKVEELLPPLSEIVAHGNTVWKKLSK